MSSNKVNDGNAIDQRSEYHGKYMLAMVSGKWRVYEDGSYYSQTSGGVTVRGHVMRNASGDIVRFDTKEKAIEWINGGCLVFKDGRDIL